MDVLIVTIITVLSFFLYNHDNKMTPHGGDSSTNNPIKEQITVKYLQSSFSYTNNTAGWRGERCAHI